MTKKIQCDRCKVLMNEGYTDRTHFVFEESKYLSGFGIGKEPDIQVNEKDLCKSCKKIYDDQMFLFFNPMVEPSRGGGGGAGGCGESTHHGVNGK